MNARASLPTPPPISGGLPGLGHMLEFRGDYISMLQRGVEEHGHLFRFDLGPWPVAVFVGPELNEVFYKRTDHELDMGPPYAYLEAMFGKVAFTAGKEAYESERHVLHAPFKGGRMPAYVAAMQDEVQAWLDTLPDEGRFELVAAVQGLTQQIAARCLMGEAFRDRMGDAFWLLYEDLAKGLDPVMPTWLPLPKFIRRDRAKAKLRPMIAEVVRERRSGDVHHDDVLQALCETALEDGTLLAEEKVVSYVLAMVFAGFETTTGHGSWGLIQLLQHPEARAEVEAELAPILGEPLTPGRLGKLTILKGCLKETERLKPAADRHMRKVAETMEVGGYRIPEGWLVMSGVAASHRLPEEFAEPDRYDPHRYARGEGKGQYRLVGFGAGRHRCTGMAFAYAELTVLMAMLLDQLDLSLENDAPQRQDFSGVCIPEATWVSYRRRPRPLHAAASEGAGA